jgi:hypothetical protein
MTRITKILFPPGYAADGLVLSLAVHLGSLMAVGVPVNEESNRKNSCSSALTPMDDCPADRR